MRDGKNRMVVNDATLDLLGTRLRNEVGAGNYYEVSAPIANFLRDLINKEAVVYLGGKPHTLQPQPKRDMALTNEMEITIL